MKIITIAFVLFSFFAHAQNNINVSPEKQEVVLVGTMHGVPNIIKNAYKPMLKKAKRNNPDAIFLEYVPSHDVESIAFDTPEFLKLADSISKEFIIDVTEVEKITDKDLVNMTKLDFTYMIHVFTVRKDYSNYQYYKYLLKYGVEGSKEPLRNESGDVSFPLAIHQNLKYIHSMDYQSSNKFYHEKWAECDSLAYINDEVKELNKVAKKQYYKDVFGTLVYGLAKQVNINNTMVSYHKMNSFDSRKESYDACQEASYWWDFRNEKMAENIGDQVIDQGIQKSIVIVGTGHIIGLEKELTQQFPQLKITRLYK